MGKKDVKRPSGLLYDKLVVMPGPATFPAYYLMVKQIIREMEEEFPVIRLEPTKDDLWDFVNAMFFWHDKWFGSELVKKDDK